MMSPIKLETQFCIYCKKPLLNTEEDYHINSNGLKAMFGLKIKNILVNLIFESKISALLLIYYALRKEEKSCVSVGND